MLIRKLQSYSTTSRTNVPVFSANSFCAFPNCDGSNILVRRLSQSSIDSDSSDSQSVVLSGHHSAITGLTIHPTRCELCSAASDYVIYWDLKSAFAHHAAGSQIRGKVIGSGLGAVTYLSFSYHGNRVAVCTGDVVTIIDTKDATTECLLEGHDGLVTCAEFSPHYLQVLVSAADDRTFKVWDLEDRCLLYKSCIVSSSPFISLSMRLAEPWFALGTMDGMVRMYDLNGETGYRQLHQIDLTKISVNFIHDSTAEAASGDDALPVISSRPRWQHQRAQSIDKPEQPETEVGCLVLTMTFLEEDSEEQQTVESDVFRPSEDESEPRAELTLLVATSTGIFSIDMKTLECRSFANFLEPLHEEETPINTVGSCSLTVTGEDQLYCIVSSLFEPTVHLLSLERTGNETDAADGRITVLSSAPLHAQSPLRSELRPKQTEKSTKVAKSTISYKQTNISGSLNKKGRIADKQPIVVRNKIRSSGYGSDAPRSAMFKPQTNSTKSKSTTPSKRGSVDGGDGRPKYPSDSAAPTELRLKINVDTKPIPINSICFRGDGQQLCCSLSNATSQVYKLPLSADKVTSLVGHTTAVTKARWSHDQQWLVTASEQCACVHNLSQKEPIMVLDRVKDNFEADKETAKVNVLFRKPVCHAQFYYMDKFLLLASGSSVNLYKYHLDLTKSDLKRYVAKSRYKLVTSLGLRNAHAISAMSAVNSFYSYMVLCAGSDKSVELFDMNVAKSVRSMPDCHSKPIHTLVQNEGSAFCDGGSVNYDSFLTAAAGDGLKLWDVRADRCVQRYEGHCNRAHSCGVAFSPCGRFIATGAEDKSAYIYDLRQSTYSHKLTGHTDVVSDVAFHPRLPQLYTATLDGQIRVFTPL